eukprot:4774034-Prymnesium_polylepis.1
MPLAECVRGVIQNLLGEKGDAAVIRDCTYIKADRYDWRLAKPLKGQSLSIYRKWLECWQNIEVNDLHHFPLWEKGVFDILQESFQDLMSIFAHYAKSVGGSTTAEDAVEITLTEFKDLVRDTGLETKDLKFDVMGNMFKKANAVNNAEAHAARTESRKTGAARADSTSKKAGFSGAMRSASARKLRGDEVDQELVLYEFVEVLIRIAFWRANPYHGIHKLAQQLVPLPDCLHQMLNEVSAPHNTSLRTLLASSRPHTAPAHLRRALMDHTPPGLTPHRGAAAERSARRLVALQGAAEAGQGHAGARPRQPSDTHHGTPPPPPPPPCSPRKSMVHRAPRGSSCSTSPPGCSFWQAILTLYEPKLLVWFNTQTQSMFLRGEGRKLQYQVWQDVLT